ncbi:hypothetical protein L9F63_010252, partial [Diploptera punctata]
FPISFVISKFTFFKFFIHSSLFSKIVNLFMYCLYGSNEPHTSGLKSMYFIFLI